MQSIVLSDVRTELVPHRQADAVRVLEVLAAGGTLLQASKAVGTNEATVIQWRMLYPAFDAEVSRARKIGADAMVDKLPTIHEDIADVQRARLASENYRWIAARRDPAQFGDKVSIDVHQQVSIAAPLAAGRARMLRSRRDLSNVEDAQVIEAQAETVPKPTDTVSVDGMPSIDDLLS